VPLTQILATVNRHALFTDELQHWQQRQQQRVREKALYAGVMGLGCGIGTRRMARIAQGVGEAELEHAVNWHFSLDNVQAANDRVLRLTSEMDLPEIYRRAADSLHTASDGQKFEVRKESLNANYSFKYFGKGQGASAYSFIDERQLLWHSLVFSAAERESAYVIDGLMRNDVIKSDIHSTDSHGYTEAIFSATHWLGISYAPRLKSIDRHTLYIFRSRRDADRGSWAVAPDKYVNTELILANWDEMLRLIATIKLKETTASDIFRRLNSYAQQHMLYRALKAFGQIIKSLFILRYLDELALRQAIEQQLNRVELANRFTRDVAVGNPREFLQAEKEEQEIAEACNRLIKNSIVCWNYLYLGHKLAALRDIGQKQALLIAIASHSMLTWAHVNLLGEYDFSDEKLRDSFGLRPLRTAA
jgi:TnpA family transposase